MVIKIKNINKLWFILLPIFPLLDFLLLKTELPLATIIYFIVIIIQKIKVKLDVSVLGLLVCYIISIIANSIFAIAVPEYIYSIMLVCFSLFVPYWILHSRQGYDYIRWLTYLYFFINLMIYINRLFIYDFDFMRVRGGASFYGGNTAHLFYMFLFWFATVNKIRKDIITSFFMGTFNAILFISKGAMVIQILLLLYLIFLSSSFTYKKKLGIVIILCTVVAFLNNLGFFDLLFDRMNIYSNSVDAGNSVMGTRGKIFFDCLDYLSNHMFVVFFGCGLGRYHYIDPYGIGYSNPHNILLDVWFGAGIIGMFIFAYILFCILVKSKNRFLFVLIIMYAMLEGIQLFFVDSSTKLMWSMPYIYFIYAYMISQENSKRGIL